MDLEFQLVADLLFEGLLQLVESLLYFRLLIVELDVGAAETSSVDHFPLLHLFLGCFLQHFVGLLDLSLKQTLHYLLHVS